MVLARTNKPLAPNELSFRCAPFLSKLEIQEYLTKLYKMPFKDQAKPETVNHMGKIMTERATRRQWRRKDHKKITVKLEYEVDPDFQKLY